MGTASKIISVILRVGELVCASIVTGILGYYLSILDDADVPDDGRIVYAVAIGGISIFFSLVLMPPLRYSFWAFPLDLALFICWMVAFGLLCNRSGTQGCDSVWYWNTWGYYWGGWWRTVPVARISPAIVGYGGCSSWRSSLAFSFIGGIIWFGNALLGLYVSFSSRKDPARADSESSSQPQTKESENPAAVEQS
ncbi:hypothetical protein B0A52_08928 [Exophiala mesophila]|uniref:MARVEL domain-containing protein n=1 Tax=Exophiala mesophila TaxID=212818 RepID=A0A438MUV2_EXOME|nr:hypothetical protein B0A52_08928 [Exophiala mesophila]